MPYLDIWRHPNENFISSRWSSNAATFSFYDATGSNKLAYWVYFLPIWSISAPCLSPSKCLTIKCLILGDGWQFPFLSRYLNHVFLYVDNSSFINSLVLRHPRRVSTQFFKAPSSVLSGRESRAQLGCQN